MAQGVGVIAKGNRRSLSARRAIAAYALLAIAAGGYSLVAWELSVAHAKPMPEPFLRIADPQYFQWATLFYAPVILAAWLLAAGCVYLLTRAMRSQAAFDDLIRALALATGVGTLGTLVPDLITSPLRAAGVIDELAWESAIANHGGWFFFTWATLIIYAALFATGYTLAVRRVASTTWGWSIAVGVAGFVVFQGFEYIFIR